MLAPPTSQDEILTAVAEVAERLLRGPRWRDAVPDALGLLGEAAAADRTFFFECETEADGRLFTRMTYEWVADGVVATIDTPLWQHCPQDAEDVAAWLRGEVLNFVTSELDAEERAVLEAEGTQSTLAVPVVVGERLVALIGFDACRTARRWMPAETEALRAAAGALGAAIEREGWLDELARREAILRAVASASERLLQAERVEDAIDDVLMLLGRGTSSSRAYMFETVADAGGLSSTMRYEWTAPGIGPTIGRALWQGYREREWHAERLLRGEPSWLRAADDGAEERVDFEQEGTLVYVSVPIRARGRLWGYLGFDDCVTERVWSPLELEALRAAAGTIGAALERESTAARLDARERILEAVAVGAERLLQEPSWLDAIDDVLELLGRAGAASRCWMFRCEDRGDRVVSTLTNEWVADGFAPSLVPEFWQDRLEPVDAVETFLRGEAIQRLRDDMPPEARARLEAEGTLSIICVPILVGGRLAGYIGYDDCVTARRWSPSEEEALRIAASVIASAAQRAQTLQAVRRREELLGAVASAAQRALTAVTTEAALEVVLAEIGAATDTSRVFACRLEALDDGSLRVMQNVQWAAPGFAVADPSIWEGLVVSRERAEAFARGEALQGLARDEDGPFRAALDATETVSFLVVPVIVRGRLWGALGFNQSLAERRWDMAETEGLRAAAGTLSAIVEREQTQEALRRSDEQLWQAQKMDAIGRLAAGVAHDLRNYLTVIVSYATFVREQLPEGARADADALLETAGRVAELVDRLLSFGRPQERTDPVELDVGEVLTGVRDVIEALLPEGQSLSLSVSPELEPVVFDRGQLERVIVNLALNARDAMPGSGALALVARPDPLGVALDVVDTGVGMDASTATRALEPFFTTKAGLGTGLGLPIVYGIVTRGGGTLDITSAPGSGTCVTVRLPRAA